MEKNVFQEINILTFRSSFLKRLGINMEKINIVFITDENYFDFFLVSLKSLLDKTNSEVVIRVVLTFPINETAEKAEEEIKRVYKNAEFTYCFFDEDIYLNDIKSKNHVSKAAYAKIFLPNILDDINKVIFLDSDILVEDDIKKLWNCFNNGSFTIGAVWNPGYDQDNKILGLDAKAKTFNSGVMLMNLKEMRIKQDTLNLKKFIDEKNSSTYLNDQAAFNYVYAKNWYELPLRWNTQYHLFYRSNKYLNISKYDYNKLIHNPGIIHFTSKSKPWQRRNAHPYKANFLAYYNKEEAKKNYINDSMTHLYEAITIRTKFDINWYLKKKLKLRNLKKVGIRRELSKVIKAKGN